MAKEPYVGPARPAPKIVAKIDYEAWGKIKFDMDQALYAGGPGRFPVSFFHLGMFFPKAVEMNVVEAGQAREIIYDPSIFRDAGRLPRPGNCRRAQVSPASASKKRAMPPSIGGAMIGSPFSAPTISARSANCINTDCHARAVALDVAVAGKAEEFPDFVEFYIDESGPKNGLTLYALLEGPSIVGACTICHGTRQGRRHGCRADVLSAARRHALRHCALDLHVLVLGNLKPTAVDWRPEVHDSDGLAIWTGNGERLWRPLNNPPRIMASSFLDDNPRGFGLLQRDRDFDHYLDGVFYDRRPSLWVEPKGKWGKGAIQLVEIPTDDEIHDNIVAMWVADRPAAAGQEISARLSASLARRSALPEPTRACVATRLGNGGQPGKPRPKGVRKFMVEFIGGSLDDLPYGVKPEAVLWASRGTFSYIYHRGGAGRCAGPLAGAIRSHGYRRRAGRNAAVSALGREGFERDVDVSNIIPGRSASPPAIRIREREGTRNLQSRRSAPRSISLLWMAQRFAASYDVRGAAFGGRP